VRPAPIMLLEMVSKFGRAGITEGFELLVTMIAVSTNSLMTNMPHMIMTC
jgi:hypothetical protein